MFDAGFHIGHDDGFIFSRLSSEDATNCSMGAASSTLAAVIEAFHGKQLDSIGGSCSMFSSDFFHCRRENTNIVSSIINGIDQQIAR